MKICYGGREPSFEDYISCHVGEITKKKMITQGGLLVAILRKPPVVLSSE